MYFFLFTISAPRSATEVRKYWRLLITMQPISCLLLPLIVYPHFSVIPLYQQSISKLLSNINYYDGTIDCHTQYIQVLFGKAFTDMKLHMFNTVLCQKTGYAVYEKKCPTKSQWIVFFFFKVLSLTNRNEHFISLISNNLHETASVVMSYKMNRHETWLFFYDKGKDKLHVSSCATCVYQWKIIFH